MADFDAPTPAEGDLRAYIGEIATELGVRSGGVTSEVCEVSNAYIALDRRIPDFPDRDVAVIWDERHGWAVAIEAHCGEDLIVLAFMGQDAAPGPRAVSSFVRAVLDGERPDTVDPPCFDDRLGLVKRLAEFGACIEPPPGSAEV